MTEPANLTWAERMRLSRAIRGFRVRHDLTQADLARMCGLSQPTVWRFEHMTVTRPSVLSVLHIAHGLGEDVYELLGRPKPRVRVRATSVRVAA